MTTPPPGRELPGIQDPPKKRSNFGCGAGCLVVAAGLTLLFLIVWAVGSMSSKEDEPYDPNWSGEVISQCEDLVSQQLKSPSTAEFDTDATGNGTWTVTGTVDAQNSFGAIIRSEFQCTVIVEGESIKRRLDYFG